MKFGRAGYKTAYICVLLYLLTTYMVNAYRCYKSNRRKPVGMCWKSRYTRQYASPLKLPKPPLVYPIPSNTHCISWPRSAPSAQVKPQDPSDDEPIGVGTIKSPGPSAEPPCPRGRLPHQRLSSSPARYPIPVAKLPSTTDLLWYVQDQMPGQLNNHTGLASKLSCPAPIPKRLSPCDPTSYSRPEQAIITHMSLNLNVDFEKEVLAGQVALCFYVMKDIYELPLDVNCLKINSIETSKGARLLYTMGGDCPENRTTLTMGSKLTIKLKDHAKPGDQLKVIIKYSTDPAASALTWLKPFQTSGKKCPYLFSQCSPIHARSIVPCQDTPAVRFTYDAAITAPEGLTVLMSALKGRVTSKNKSLFAQPVPIPSTLLAIAVGCLECKKIGPRSKVWAEKENIEKCAAEFSETEKYLQAAEKVCGPYDWTEYDILVLPPSYSHGAMENPCLTFVSPTVVVGDKSLVSVIIHEITHSWTGNAVSIMNFEHFWLNEGFAVFLQRKLSVYLMEEANNTEIARQHLDMSYVMGLQVLSDTIDSMGCNNSLTQMVVKLDGVHPADAFSNVPYEKGALFLKYLEDLLGGPKVFEKFLRAYIRKFSIRSLNSNIFKAYLIKRFKGNAKLKQIDWKSWYYSPGMPHFKPDLDRTLAKPVERLTELIQDPNYVFTCKDVKDFSSTQIIYLLQLLINKPPMAVKRLCALGKEYQIDHSDNKEIMYRWLRLCIRSKDESKVVDVFNFLHDLGRLSYVRPLYSDLYAWEEHRNQTIKYFLDRERYMARITAYNVRKDLHISC